MHKPTRDEMTNSGIVEEEGKVEEKTKAAHQEKINVVIISIIASSGLMILKFSVGALTNSLGILSEGMNSGLESHRRPSDPLCHTYGVKTLRSIVYIWIWKI